MLSAEAKSFRSKSRLAISLSWIAGYTNVASLITCDEVLSHQTGNSTHLGQEISGMLRGEHGAVHHGFYFAFLVTAFLFGSICSALMTEAARRAGRRSKYILPITVEAILLSLLILLLILHPSPKSDSISVLCLVTGIASFAMGLQNATITKISGAVVRTTHLTGVITDFGIESVQYVLWWRDHLQSEKPKRVARALKISRRHPSAQRLALLASIFGSFIFGAILGGLLYTRFAAPAMLVPVVFLVGIVISSFRRTR